MTQELNLGTKRNGTPFTIPQDALVQTFAFLGIRGSGKTCGALVLAEEFYKASLPWIYFDPIGVAWGLRAKPDGSGNGIPVVIFGGQHADLPLTDGKKIADALMSEPICAVLDVSQESKRFWHTFLTNFCLRLMELNPDVPRHLFIEEGPEFIPQRTKIDLTARCKEAVERLIRLGRNRGYGCTVISQRPATVDKDALSQLENLFVMRTVGPHDRKALKEWIEVKNVGAEETMLNELPGLPNGAAYFWSPHWQHKFERMLFRRRETFHPGETRQIGKAMKAVSLTDVGKFVERLRPALNRTSERFTLERPAPTGHLRNPDVHQDKLLRDVYFGVGARNQERALREGMEEPNLGTSFADNAFRERISQLEDQLADERTARRQAEVKIQKLRDHLKPQYDALSNLFAEIGQSNGSSGVDRSAYEPWLQKAGRAGTKRLLEIMIERHELTRTQLATLAGLAPGSGTYANYLSWLRRNGLVESEGSTVRLRQL